MKFLAWLWWRMILLGVLLWGVVGVQAQAKPDFKLVDSYIQSLMSDYEIPGLGLSIVKDGVVVYAQGYGVRDIDSKQPVTPETEFNIGSISKSFTALAVAQLVDAGKLSLDAPITTYLPDFKLSDSAATPKLTLRYLLSNSGGFKADDAAWYGGKVKSLAAVESYIGTLPVTSNPGSTYEYNNLGYALAGYIVENVSGESWGEYVKEHIFTPLKMENASTGYTALQQKADYARPHQLDVLLGNKVIPYFSNIDAIAPAGAVNASALEMANYALLQLGDGSFEGQAVVSKNLLDVMHTTRVETYGLGWAQGTMDGYNTVWHNGAIDGFGALLTMIPSEHVAVFAVMNGEYDDNSGFLETIVQHTLEVVLGLNPTENLKTTMQTQTGLNPLDRKARFEAARAYQPDIAGYAAFVGDYSGSFGAIHISLEQDHLMVLWDNAGLAVRFPLVEFKPHQFIGNGRGLINSVMEIQSAADGSVTLLADGNVIGQKAR